MQFLRTLQAGSVALACLFSVSCSSTDIRRDYTMLPAPSSLDAPGTERFERARDYLRQGDLDGAMVLLEELEEQHPGQARIEALRAMALWKLHRCEKAAKALGTAREAAKKPDAQLNLALQQAAADWIGQILDDQSGCEGGTARPLELMLAGPHGALAPRHLELLKRQLAALATAGRCDGALNLYKVLDPKALVQDSTTLEALARCLTMLGRDQQLLELAQAFAAQDGPDADARILQLANIAEQRFRFATAISLLSMSSRPLGSPDVPLHLARLLLMDGRRQEAVIQLEAFCGQGGDIQLQSARLKQAAWLLGRFGMVVEATEFFSRLEGLHGARWELLADRVAMLWTAGQPAKAHTLLLDNATAESFSARALELELTFLANVKGWAEGDALLAKAPATPLTKVLTAAFKAKVAKNEKATLELSGLEGAQADVAANLLCRLGFRAQAETLLLAQLQAQALGTEGFLTAARCLSPETLAGPRGAEIFLLALPQREGRMRVAGSSSPPCASAACCPWPRSTCKACPDLPPTWRRTWPSRRCWRPSPRCPRTAS